MDRDHRIEALLRGAENDAVRVMVGLTASPDNLTKLATRARDNILQQIKQGEWKAWGVTSAKQFDNLVCICEVFDGSILFLWDFKKTSLQYLKTWNN